MPGGGEGFSGGDTSSAPAGEVMISELAAAAAAAVGGLKPLKPGHSTHEERSIDISSRWRIFRSVCKKTTAIGPTTMPIGPRA